MPPEPRTRKRTYRAPTVTRKGFSYRTPGAAMEERAERKRNSDAEREMRRRSGREDPSGHLKERERRRKEWEDKLKKWQKYRQPRNPERRV